VTRKDQERPGPVRRDGRACGGVKMRLAKCRHKLRRSLFRWFPDPMTKIRFDNGITVTIRDGIVQAPSPTLAAFLDTIAATLPGYGSLPFELDADYNIARGIIEKIGVRKNRPKASCSLLQMLKPPLPRKYRAETNSLNRIWTRSSPAIGKYLFSARSSILTISAVSIGLLIVIGLELMEPLQRSENTTTQTTIAAIEIQAIPLPCQSLFHCCGCGQMLPCRRQVGSSWAAHF
jgi:hypothetical protein